MVLAGAAAAQNAAPLAPPPFKYVNLSTVTVRPSAVADFEGYLKKINAAAAKVGIRPSNFYSVGRGGTGFTYLGSYRFDKWSELDERPPLGDLLKKAYGDVEGTKIFNAGRATIESSSSVVLRVLPELSASGPLDPPPAHARITHIELHPGNNTKWETYVAKVKAAQDKAGNPLPVIRYATSLGNINEYYGVVFFDKYAQLDGQPALGDVLRKAYGEGEARLLEEAAQSMIKSVEVHMVDFRTDLTKP